MKDFCDYPDEWHPLVEMEVLQGNFLSLNSGSNSIVLVGCAHLPTAGVADFLFHQRVPLNACISCSQHNLFLLIYGLLALVHEWLWN